MSEIDIENEIERYFHFISYYYNRESDFSLTANYQFMFTYEGKTHEWYFSVDKEKTGYGKGKIENQDISICTSYPLWLQISSGKKSAVKEYFKKTFTIKGPLKYLQLLTLILAR